jgi:hypothetical protein
VIWASYTPITPSGYHHLDVIYSSCMRFDGWKLGCIEVSWLGVFIAPTTKRTVGGGCCRMPHRTVRCATGHCPVCQPRHPIVGFWPLEFWHWATRQSGGAPDSYYSLSGAPSGASLTSVRAGAHCSVAVDRWRCVAVTPLAHRTVWCYTGQSGEL